MAAWRARNCSGHSAFVDGPTRPACAGRSRTHASVGAGKRYVGALTRRQLLVLAPRACRCEPARNARVAGAIVCDEQNRARLEERRQLAKRGLHRFADGAGRPDPFHDRGHGRGLRHTQVPLLFDQCEDPHARQHPDDDRARRTRRDAAARDEQNRDRPPEEKHEQPDDVIHATREPPGSCSDLLGHGG